MEARARFPPELASARRARRFAEEALQAWAAETVIDDARLLISELVGNAILHAQTAADLRIVLDEDHVRVEVHDGSRSPLHVRSGVVDSTSGRGLVILDAVAESWGVEQVDGGKTVWFELSR